MSDHLPECPCYLALRENVCICDRLRACEQRVDKAWHEYDQLAREGAYLSGERDARDAVAALFPMPDVPQPIRGEVVLAAIDGLMGES